MTPDRWLEENYLQEIFSGEFEHLKSIVQDLELIPSGKIITIGGTNGKGETARTLESVLRLNNGKTAVLTSPHLVDVSERFVFKGEIVQHEKLLESFLKVHSQLDQRVSYFEFLFLVFLSLVKDLKPEFIILEVGLGGRLDATNCLDADIAAITSISRDHQELLGNSYKKIFYEKAGIFRQNQRVFTSFNLDFLNQLVSERTESLSLRWSSIDVKGLNFSQANQRLAFAIASELLDKNDLIEFDSLGEQIDFAKRKSWTDGEQTYDLYPSHNPEGIRKLFQLLGASQYNNYDTLILSFSERSMRDLEAMVKTLRLSFRLDQIYFYEFDHAKSLKREKQKELKDKFGLHSLNKDTFSKKTLGKHILVTGSNYFLGEFIRNHSSS